MKLSWANRVTILRLLLIIPFVMCMLKINEVAFGEKMRYACTSIYILMLISDILDGYLARRSDEVTRFGTLLDPVADKILIACACLLLASEHRHVEGFLLPKIIVFIVIGRDVTLLIGLIGVYFTTSQLYVISPMLTGKIAGRMQLTMILLILIAPEISYYFPQWIWILGSFWWLVAGATVLSTFAYICNGSCYIKKWKQAEIL